jgi:hypothetical protein
MCEVHRGEELDVLPELMSLCGIASFGKAAKAGLLKTKRPPIRPANVRYNLVFIGTLLVG